MLPMIEFVEPREIHAMGIAVKREAGNWQYFLPFVRRLGDETPVSDSRAHLAVAVSASQVVVANRGGDFELIDLDADAVTRRQKVDCQIHDLQISSDSRRLYVRGQYSLHVLDALTLEIIQDWAQIELTSNGWQRYTAKTDHAQQQVLIDAGTLERIDIASPVREIWDDRLVAKLDKPGFDAYGPAIRSGYYVFNVHTGAIARHLGWGSPEAYRDLKTSVAARMAETPAVNVLRDLTEFEAVVEREAMLTLTAADGGRDAAIAVVNDLADRMERNIEALYACGSINIRYIIAGQPLDNGAFFARFVDENWIEAAPALRRLMLAYLNGIEGGEGGMPWHYECAGSPHAMRALMLLDLDAQDVYRLYLSKGDLEHDHWPYHFYKEYLSHRGWRHEADFRFSIHLTMSGCLDEIVDSLGPIRAGQDHVSAERLAEIIKEEAAYFHGAQRFSDLVENVDEHHNAVEWGADYFAILRRPLNESSYVRHVLSLLPDMWSRRSRNAE
jgi:hypothetical protein